MRVQILEVHWTFQESTNSAAVKKNIQKFINYEEDDLKVLEGKVSLAHPEFLDKLMVGNINVGHICVPRSNVTFRFDIDETTKKREVDIPFYMSGAPKKYLKPAEALVDKMLRRKPPVASAEKATALDKTKNTPAKKSPAAEKKDPAKKSPAAAKKDPAKKKSPASAKKKSPASAKKKSPAPGKKNTLRSPPLQQASVRPRLTSQYLRKGPKLPVDWVTVAYLRQ